MKLLLIHSDYIEYKTKKKTPVAEKISDEMKSQRAEEALVAFNLAVESNRNHLAYFQRGRTYMKLKNYPEAIIDFSKAIELNPENSDAYFRRGKAYRKIGEKRNGLEDIRNAARQGSKKAKQFLKNKGKSY